MIAPIYISGKLASEPEAGETKKGKLLVRFLIRTDQVRLLAGSSQIEEITVPVIAFARCAEAVRGLREGDSVTVKCHWNPTRFEMGDGSVKHGLQIVSDNVLLEGVNPA